MRVLKRSGEYEDVSFDKVLNRIRILSKNLSVDIYDISQKVCGRIYDGVKTSELDELTAQICSSMIVDNPDYGVLASRIIISNHHKNTSPSFSETINTLYNNTVDGEKCPLISDKLYEIVMKNKEKLNSYINYERDYSFDYFGFKTLERSYLLKVNNKIIERPQQLFMRVSLGIHSDDLKEALNTYDCMSKKYFTHATPTLFNAGTITPQNSSCFLYCMPADSLDGIFDAIKDCARISKYAGGIGIHVHNIRAKGSKIRSTNGTSDGLVPMLKVFNHVGRYINQCFTPDTLVFGEDGVIKISEVKVGDKLITHDFKDNAAISKSVLGISKNYVDKEILEIKTSIGLDTVKVTKEHELFVKKENGEPSFIPASDLVIGDMMCYPEKSGMFWFDITDIKTISYKGDVYDLNMEDNHNYTVVNLGLVHNSGKRNGSIAVYLEPWHSDVESFLDLKKNHGNEEDRARDLFYALWIPDLFMERVKQNKTWSLMCPDKCRGLSDVWGKEFVDLYEKYESEGKFVKQMPAQELWFKILESQIETGTPYLTYKDACNAKSNQQNIGTIKSLNLCSEISQVSTADECSVCNLSSVCLPTYITTAEDGTKYFDFDKLHEITMIATKNLNKIIDINFYPIEKAKKSNFRHRPIGIGVQGLADTYILMGYPFDSPEAFKLNKDIFETMYHASCEASMLISKKRYELIQEFKDASESKKEEILKYINPNDYETIDSILNSNYPGAYQTFEGSPASMGKLQFDLWNYDPTNERYDWEELKQNIIKYGMRNSLLLAPMPTASTSQIMGFTESFECITSNIYKRKTLAGEFVLVNKYLINDLIKLNLWNKDMKNKIMLGEGSIQHISEIPENIRALYKTVWELSQKVVIDQSADRGPFICQSQSLNLFLDPSMTNFQTLTSMHMYAHSKGLKTGCYYLRTKPQAKTQQFTIDPTLKSRITEQNKANDNKKIVCTDEVCTMCSS